MDTKDSFQEKKVCISFTGGKDSTLTLHLLSLQPNYNITSLITFAPSKTNSSTPRFLSHPQDLIQLQSQCLSIPHKFIEISAPFLESYRKQISLLNVDYLATGDILDVCDGFMEKAVKETGVELLRPLWCKDRKEILEKIFELNFEILVTCVNLEKLRKSIVTLKISNNINNIDDDVEKIGGMLVGKVLNRDLYQTVLKKFSDEYGMDECGEYGDFHTMTLDAPLFKKHIIIKNAHKKLSDCGNFLYYLIEDCEIVDKIFKDKKIL
ncbi:15712_t:CDS:2 [Entrophospora sp. SA101]|nr:15712_t:CDS:2 [Entrophospora sp. SA101]